jgi:hypothetical protein
MAFIDLDDQFIALQKGSSQEPGGRHLDFYDPWGNRVQIVGYDDIQFSKALNVLRGMGMAHLTKSTKAIKNLRRKACRQTRLKLGLTPNLRIVNRSICRMQCGIYVSKSPVP